jgi:hydroxymethylglutaryl-CoA synthase
MSKPAGISDITISIPRLYIPLANRNNPDEPTEFSLNRIDERTKQPVNPRKYLEGIGVAKMAVPDTYQDASVLASNAIYELIQRNDIRPKNINRIEIGTETGPDESKSMGMYVIGNLERKLGKGSLKRCASPESKAACASTAFALENALDWIWSGRSNDNCRIVCGTDIAKYGLKSGGEPTQGASAAAILVESNPKLLEFDKIFGQYTEDESSFYRPNYSHVAFVDGEKSEKMYLYAMREAFDHYKEQAIASNLVNLKTGETLTDHFDLFSFHQPFPAMSKKGFARLLMHEYRSLPRWKPIVEEIGEEPRIEDFIDEKSYDQKHKEFLKRFIGTRTFQDTFNKKMADGQEASIEEGNSYTASIWNHLVSLLTLKDKRGEDLTNKKGALAFFGSGCTAAGQSYTILPDYSNVIRSFNLMEKLKNRTALSLQDYEDLHENKPLSNQRKFILPPENEFVLTKIENGYRHYDFVD